MEKRPDEANGIVARWYVIHTYSGYEQKVTDSILKAVETVAGRTEYLRSSFQPRKSQRFVTERLASISAKYSPAM